MKFNVLRTDLVEAVSNVSRAVSSKASIPALEGVLIKAYGQTISISGYNLEIGITTNIDATIQSEGEIVVPASTFNAFIRKLPEEVVCIETDERMKTYITSGSASYKLIGISSVEYPDLPVFEETNRFEIAGDILSDMIHQTVYAVSDNNNAKPIYTGSLFEIKDKLFKIVAVDGYRMAIRQEAIEDELESNFVVPGKTQNEVIKLIKSEENVKIGVGQRHIVFKIGEYSLISRLIEGTFLDYERTIPKETKTEVVVNTRRLIATVDRMMPVNSDKIQSPVRLSFSNDQIHFSCTSALNSADDIIEAPIMGEDVEIGFNNRYLFDAIRNIDSDEIKLVLNGSRSPMIINPVKGDSFKNLVVPMMIANG